MEEKLKWLMKALNISGIELADFLGVDYSTVSKWRTGKRSLKYQSGYIKRLAEYALSTPAEKEGRILRDMLLKADPGLDTDDPAKLQNALSLWLTVPQRPAAQLLAPAGKTEKGGFSTLAVESSVGSQNMFLQQRRFFRTLREMEPGQLITVTDFGAVDWSEVDGALVEDTVADVLASLRLGHHMRIVDQITGTYRPWDYMFRFLPIYLNEKVSSYFYMDPQPSPLRQNMFLIGGKAALTASSTPSDPGRVITALWRDPENVAFYGAVADTLLAASHPMIQTMEAGYIHKLLDIIATHMKSSRLLYMVNRLPTFRNMTAELLREILAENHVRKDIGEECLLANQTSSQTRLRCRCRQIYDLDAIEAASMQDSFIEYDLSTIAGRKIRVTREQFLRQLAHLKDTLGDEQYSLVLYPFSELKIIPPPCNIIVQDDSLSAAWDVEKYPRRMYSEELSIVNGFYQYAESVWDSIPPVCKTVEWCKRQIDRILTNTL